jgi:hypothetical protein
MKVRGWWLALVILALVACEGSDGGGGPDVAARDTTGPADTGATGPDTAAPADTPAPADVPAPPADVPVPPLDAPVPPEDVPAPLPDVPAPPADVPVPPLDVPAPPADVPVGPDVPRADVSAPPADRLTVDCAVPYVLDGSKVSDMFYMAMHFEHLIQRYCITGTYQGADITSFPEKMFYGSHLPTDDALTLTQISMQSLTVPRFSVRVDFAPDTAVLPGSQWAVGLDEGNALAVLLGHPSAQSVCLLALAAGGSLQFAGVLNVTQTEGGSFRVAGALDMVPARDIPDACEIFAASGLSCCE